MKALILAAGLGTRLRPLTDQIPKPMVPIGGKPMLEHHIEHLSASGIKEICVNLHHLPEKITDYFGDGSRWGVKIFYKFEPQILGTAGAIKNFEDLLSDDFLLIYGDMLHRLDLEKFTAFHKNRGGLATIVVHQEGNPANADILELGDNSKVLRLVPKPHSIEELAPHQWKMQAIYAMSKKICDHIPAGQYCELDHETLPTLIQAGQAMYGYPTEEFIRDIGTWEQYRKAEEYLIRINPNHNGQI